MKIMKKKVLLFAVVAFMLNSNAQAQGANISNSDMESWHSVSSFPNLHLTAPDDWFGTDSLVSGLAPMAAFAGLTIHPKKQLFKSNDSHSGSFSAEIKSKDIGDSIGIMPGILSNAQIEVNFAALLPVIIGGGSLDPNTLIDNLSYKGGTSITGPVDTVSAWVKTDSANADEAVIFVSVRKTITNDSSIEVGSAFYTIPATFNEFTQVHVPITYTLNETPDKLIILFESSNLLATTPPTEDNSMKVDDVSFTYAPVGINPVVLQDNYFSVYPNPASNLINFKVDANKNISGYQLAIMDATGSVIKNMSLSTSLNSIHIEQWASGLYFYTFSNTNHKVVQKGKFIVK